MERLPAPRNAEGKTPRAPRGTVGTPLPSNKINQNIPPGVGRFTPFIPTSGATAGDTCYFLLNSVFDPRTLQTNAGANVYTALSPGHDYRSIWTDLLYQVIFDQFKMRQEPSTTVLNDMIDNIVDTTRLLCIYLSSLSMSASRDPDMFGRARILNLHDSKVEMGSMLASLPLPRYLVELCLKYVGIVDVAGSYNYQNIGFLANGDYDNFLTIYNNVMSRALARNFMRQIYPEIGLIGDPDGSKNVADILQMFINANSKLSSDGFVPYVLADQASDEPLMMQSGGILSSSLRGGGTAFTATGWAVPGTGIAGVSSVRSWIPSLCVWKTSTGRDAALTRTVASQAYSFVAPNVNAETLLDAALATNMAHEYNMNVDNTNPLRTTVAYNGTTGGFVTNDSLATEDTRYRVSAGFSLGQLSYDLQANTVATFRDILLP